MCFWRNWWWIKILDFNHNYCLPLKYLRWVQRLTKSTRLQKPQSLQRREQSAANIKLEPSSDSSSPEPWELPLSPSISGIHLLLRCLPSSISSLYSSTHSILKRLTNPWPNATLLFSWSTPELTKFKSKELSTKSIRLSQKQSTLLLDPMERRKPTSILDPKTMLLVSPPRWASSDLRSLFKSISHIKIINILNIKSLYPFFHFFVCAISIKKFYFFSAKSYSSI